MSKIFFYHGLYTYIAFGEGYTRHRSTDNKMRIPRKLEEALQKAFWIHQDKIGYVPYVEFTLAHDKDLHIATISIVHLKDHFTKKIGYKIAKERMEWSKKQPPRVSNEMWWSCDFE